MKITKEDVGRKVVDGWGEVETIVDFFEGDIYSVMTERGYNYTEEGLFNTAYPISPYNLIGFLDETGGK